MGRRIGLIGAVGRLGSVIAAGIAASEDLELVAAISPRHAGGTLGGLIPGLGPDLPAAGLIVAGDLQALVAAEVEIVVEVSGPASVGANLLWLLDHGIHAVVGATGITPEDLEAARSRAAAGPARALIAPNFAIGAVLLEELAARAAQYLPDVEIIELHHPAKLDAPSGTALSTAAAIAAARATGPVAAAVSGPAIASGARGSLQHGIPVHSVRLPGLVAHEEVLLGATGQLLTLRHDAFDRSAFVPGALLACRRVATLDGLVVGLGALL